MHGRNWEKKWTDTSMRAKRKWRTYCHLSDGRKWRWGKAVEEEKVSTSNWTIYVLWQCLYFIVTWNNCIRQAARHTHYTWVKNNQADKSLSTYFKENTFLSTDFYKYLFILKPRLHVKTWPYKISLLINALLFFTARDEAYKSSRFAYESLGFIMDKTKPRQSLNTVSKTHHKFQFLWKC